MEVKAEHRYAKISAFKVREVTREIQGLPAEAALEIVRLIPKKAARLIGKVLASAIANAENNNNSENKTLRAENLVIKEAIAGEGPTLKRMHTRARGSGARINKRTAHIRITLVEAEPVAEKPRKPRAQKKDKPKATPSAPKAAAPKAEAAPAAKAEDTEPAAPAIVAPEPPADQLKAEKADKTSHSYPPASTPRRSPPRTKT
ncbi:MAG: 50S ribosomal protein L22 [Verrucomicrobiota bacterium]